MVPGNIHAPHERLLEIPKGTAGKGRETVKTILLEQDPPYHKKDSGLFLYSPTPPPPPHFQRWRLGYIAPILSGIKTEKKIQTSLDCFTTCSNASFVQTEC